MGVLNVEDRVVPRLLGDLGEIEIERCVVLPVEHHETNGASAHLVYDLPQRDERPGTFGHLDRLASAKQANELTNLDVEMPLAPGEGRNSRFHPLDMAAMVGAEHVDHGLKAA